MFCSWQIFNVIGYMSTIKKFSPKATFFFKIILFSKFLFKRKLIGQEEQRAMELLYRVRTGLTPIRASWLIFLKRASVMTNETSIQQTLFLIPSGKHGINLLISLNSSVSNKMQIFGSTNATARTSDPVFLSLWFLNRMAGFTLVSKHWSCAISHLVPAAFRISIRIWN